MNAFLAMSYRQLKRFTRAKSRVFGSLLNPIVWLLFFGVGWSRAFNFPAAREIFGGVDYLSYLIPGVVSMTIFSGSFISGVTVIWDKQFGFLKETLVAPTSRSEAILGRIIGDSITALLQGVLIMIFSLSLVSLNIYGMIPTIIVGFILAVAFSSVGITLGLKINSQEGFHLIFGLMMQPLIFLSGAFYPIDAMPLWMKVLSYINPLTYAVDSARYFLTGVSKFEIFTNISILFSLSVILVCLAMYSFEKAVID
ncbi:daunorubicin resistance ABC transporter, inner membrane subunit B [Methanococcus vannielii SB]|jgi:ABC-2 type transport system permease protein|uniref:Daunorubicin resistance ABC transporter, inner membrane subunit B n=1 Tax=Methanococcus vannielii (strain ATCC 35089 / DSM 1224 / JCM 13029 / OCM 148 / SB) TaxID=406327 RepID=A6URE6_METVS|nr:ABC transporter permease [Methanococcus vannielii]ABR55068.1 daunorubicin resistance ABC transporter, inner membrane subunit B [Methanococcus vannielii SB]